MRTSLDPGEDDGVERARWLVVVVETMLLAACGPSPSPTDGSRDREPVLVREKPEPEEREEPSATELLASGEEAVADGAWVEARAFFVAAEERAGADAVQAAAASLALGRLAERRGLGSEAAEHFARSQRQHPSEHARQWLDGERDCGVAVGPPDRMASVETWRSLGRRLAAAGEYPPARPPRSEAAARRQLCGDTHCTGAGPWIVAFDDPPEGHLPQLAAVMPRPDGSLATLTANWFSNPDWACEREHRLDVRSMSTGALMHLRVEESFAVGAWHSCSEGVWSDDCVAYCREATAATHDWFLDPTTLDTLAVVTRTKQAGAWVGDEDRDRIPDASEVGGEVELTVEGRTVRVVGCGIQRELELPDGLPARASG